jgi:hypothetical protein
MAEAWEMYDIETYRTSNPLNYGPLIEFYQRRGLPDTDLRARANALADAVLHCTDEDYKFLGTVAAREGGVRVLKLLEQRVITAHQRGELQFPE